MKNYSNSKCPKCDNNKFETVIDCPENSNFELQFIRCKFCKTVVGVLDFNNIGAMLKILAEKLGHKF